MPVPIGSRLHRSFNEGVTWLRRVLPEPITNLIASREAMLDGWAGPGSPSGRRRKSGCAYWWRSLARPTASPYAHACRSGGCTPRSVRMVQICSRCAFAWCRAWTMGTLTDAS